MRQPEARYNDVFLSHAIHDRELATQFSEWLQNCLQLSCFISTDGIDGGKDWHDAILRAMQQCRVAVTLVTPNSQHRPWIHYEAGYLEAKGKQLIPICCPPLTPETAPSTLAHLQFVNWSSASARERFIQSIAAATGRVVALEKGPELKQLVRTPGFGLDNIRCWSRLHELEGLRLLEELHNCTPLLNDNDARARLVGSSHLLVRFFIEHYWVEYERALRNACHALSIRLPSELRRAAAIEALRRASREMWAISVLKADKWHHDPLSLYHFAQEALRLKHPSADMRRIFVVETQREMRAASLVEVRARYLAIGVDVRIGLIKDLTELVGLHTQDAHPVSNTLLVDLTLSPKPDPAEVSVAG